MPRLTDKQIAGAMRAAGFARDSWTVGVAVALAESRGNSDAVNTSNSDGSIDYGLFQINSIHSDLFVNHNWRDPTDNARMALAVSSNGSNWAPWTTYQSGAYRVYLPRATRATGSPATVPSGGGPGNSSGVVPAGLSGTSHSLTDPGTWQRLGMIVAGAFLIILALMRTTRLDNTLRGVAAKAGEAAVLA